jgi:hypothetical protein
MLVILLILFSVPLGTFSAWFAWRAWKVGKMNVVHTMSFLAFLCFSTAIIVGGWAWMALHG